MDECTDSSPEVSVVVRRPALRSLPSSPAPQPAPAAPLERAARAARAALEAPDEGEVLRRWVHARHQLADDALALAFLDLVAATREPPLEPERAVDRLIDAEAAIAAVDPAAARRCAVARATLRLALGGDAEAELGALVDAGEVEARGPYGAALAMRGASEAAEAQLHRAPDTGRVRAWLALHLALTGRGDGAVAAAQRAEHPLGEAVLAVLRRESPPTRDAEAFLLWRALEAWRARASLRPIREAARGVASIATRWVLSTRPHAPR